MRERIILAPGVNATELTRSLAMHGVNCMNLRIVGAGELARIAMMRSGIAITEDFVSAREEAALVAEAVRGEAYFGRLTYSDIREIAAAIRRMRTLVPDGDEAERIAKTLGQGVFAEKNAALVSVCVKYLRLLAERKLMDSVSLVRRALQTCRAIDADFLVLREYPLNPLEKALLERLSGAQAQETTLAQLFRAEEAPLGIQDFKNCYGASNEVESILADIYAGKHPDQCTVAVTDPGTYGQLFFDCALRYDLPVTFGCGIPVINSNPAKLLVLYYRWMTDGFFGADAIRNLLTSSAFDRSKLEELYPEPEEDFSRKALMEVLGGIRLTNDRTVNEQRIADFRKSIEEEEALVDPEDEKAYQAFRRRKLCIPYLEIIASELSVPAEEFISKYARIRRGFDTNAGRLLMSLDQAALTALYEELQVIRRSGVEQDAEDMILNVLKTSVAGVRSEEGKLYVTGIDGALSCIREELYIAGLSASNYPGSPRENYLLLDADLKLFGEGAEEMTSDGRIGRKRERLFTLARLASSLGSRIHISYAGLNVSELKRDNASSLVFELFREAKGRNATSRELEEQIVRVDYFEPAVSAARMVGAAYNAGRRLIPHTEEAAEAADVCLTLEKEYSPSALDTFFKCPRAFMLGRVLGIPEPDEDDPFQVIAPNESGTMAHALMETLGNSDMSRDDFLKLSGETFDRYILEHPPLVAQQADVERERFLDMMETAYRMDPHREVVLGEEEVHCVHESGVKIHGFPDRVEKLDDGSCLIVDFKSARSVGHEQDDIATCLQIVLYAYLMEQKGFRISGGEYRYIRLGKTVTCRYDDEMKQQLLDRLNEFREHLEAADFPIPDEAYEENREQGDPDPCRYCKYAGICGKATEFGGTDDE